MKNRVADFFIGLIVGFGLCLATHAFAEHKPGLEWMRGDVGNGSCCGVSDCQQVPVMVLGRSGGMVAAMVGDTEIVVPERWVHYSKDSHTYWCFKPGNESAWIATGRGEGYWTPPGEATRENTRCLYVTPLW